MNASRLPTPRTAFFVIIAILVGVLVGYGLAGKLVSVSFASNSYEAVFLSNNQVYFGKLSGLDSQYPVLTDVYYIQAFAAQDLSSTTKTGNKLQLVKLGSELHQPQDVMYLNRSQILFIEPLKPDSQIVTSISNFESK